MSILDVWDPEPDLDPMSNVRIPPKRSVSGRIRFRNTSFQKFRTDYIFFVGWIVETKVKHIPVDKKFISEKTRNFSVL
jgi:hypothetical protein